MRVLSAIRSRDNAKVKRWAKLARDGRLRRREGRALIEGPHLVAELLAAGMAPLALLVSESGLQRDEIRRLVGAREPVLLSDAVFRAVAEAESPTGIAAEIALPAGAEDTGHTVFLEGVQDAGNVGAIIRSAAAFGVRQLVLDRDCADPWSPKVLRAGMGGHFKLVLRQVDDLGEALAAFPGTLACAEARGTTPLREARFDGVVGWIFGSEGRGVSPATARRARLRVGIPMAPGNESLNVAAAAAICLYETFLRLSTRSAGS